MRRGREFYSQNYQKVMELHGQGLSIKEIADKLGISYSAVYHWVKGLRKPEPGNLISFKKFLEKNGPTPVADIVVIFPKHNEIYHVAKSRGIDIQRYVIPKKVMNVGDYRTWYYLKGQENELKKRINELKEKYEKIVKRFSEKIEKILNKQDNVK